MDPLELENASRRGFSQNSHVELRRQLWLRIATKTACVLMSLVLVVVIGLTMATQESSLLPANVVKRAREIYLAELSARSTPADALHAARVFSDTLIDTTRKIWAELAKDEANFPPYVLVVTGEAGRREMSMYSRMEFLIYLLDCPSSYPARRQFFKSVYDFKFLMEAASIGVDLLNQPVARASIRSFPCTVDYAVSSVLLGHDWHMISRVLEGNLFFGDVDIFLEVQKAIHAWMKEPLERAAAAAPTHDDSANLLWYLTRMPNATLGPYLQKSMEFRKFDPFYRRYYPAMREGISSQQAWEIKAWLYDPMQDFIAAEVFELLYLRDPVVDAISSNTGDRLESLLREGVWSEGKVRHGLQALWTTLKVRNRAQARSAGTKDAAQVCFSCEESGVFEVPGDLQQPLQKAVEWVVCLANAHNDDPGDENPDC